MSEVSISFDREIGILFKQDMVRALLEDRKSQTRRTRGLEAQNLRPTDWRYDGVNLHGAHLFLDVNAAVAGHDPQGCVKVVKCPYGKTGDILWVRETWQRCPKCSQVQWRSDHNLHKNCRWCDSPMGKWKPSIHMFRSDCRLFFQVESIQAQRLQDITEHDAIAEGIEPVPVLNYTGRWRNYLSSRKDKEVLGFGSARDSYRSLWDSINGNREPWHSNPWVWRVEFWRV